MPACVVDDFIRSLCLERTTRYRPSFLNTPDNTSSSSSPPILSTANLNEDELLQHNYTGDWWMRIPELDLDCKGQR